jgi:voltage-gated sodium channel
MQKSLSRGASLAEGFDSKEQTKQSRSAERQLKKLQDTEVVDKITRERNRRIERFKREENEHGLTPTIDHFSDLLFEVVKSTVFDNIILLVICVGFICSALDTYAKLRGTGWLTFLEGICVLIFFFEFVIKVLSDGARPWRYFTGPFRRENTFDFVILIGCSPFIPKEQHHVAVAMRALRLIRLVNVMGTRYKQVEMMVTALTAGFEELAYISVPTFIVFYIYAIMGIVFFRENDPFHWTDVEMSLNTLVRLLTLEDWTDELYINYFGCKDYNAGVYSSPDTDTTTDTALSRIKNLECISPEAAPWMAIFFFMSFAVLTVVLTAMFIGGISIALSRAVTQHMVTAEERRRQMRKVRGQVALYRQIENQSTHTWRLDACSRTPLTRCMLSHTTHYRCMLPHTTH